ncbi:sodium:solute symporter family protein, partial [Aduncisulcus paluster]
MSTLSSHNPLGMGPASVHHCPRNSLFFGLCAASFLPIYLLGLYWKGMTKKAAKVSMVGGFSASMFWLLFVHAKEAKAIGLCK